MKKNFKISKIIVSYLIIVFLFFIPAFSLAQDDGGLVPCGTEKSELVTNADGTKSGGDILNPCTFDHILILINKVVNFILFTLAIPIAAIMFAYAGFILLFSGGQSGKRSQAKSIFINVAIGLIFVAAAWLIINTILSIVGYTGDWTHF